MEAHQAVSHDEYQPILSAFSLSISSLCAFASWREIAFVFWFVTFVSFMVNRGWNATCRNHREGSKRYTESSGFAAVRRTGCT